MCFWPISIQGVVYSSDFKKHKEKQNLVLGVNDYIDYWITMTVLYNIRPESNQTTAKMICICYLATKCYQVWTFSKVLQKRVNLNINYLFVADICCRCNVLVPAYLQRCKWLHMDSHNSCTLALLLKSPSYNHTTCPAPSWFPNKFFFCVFVWQNESGWELLISSIIMFIHISQPNLSPRLIQKFQCLIDTICVKNQRLIQSYLNMQT